MILFTLGGLAPFGNQLVDQRRTWFYMLPHKLLGALDAPLQSRDSQFVVFDAQHDFISSVDA